VRTYLLRRLVKIKIIKHMTDKERPTYVMTSVRYGTIVRLGLGFKSYVNEIELQYTIIE